MDSSSLPVKFEAYDIRRVWHEGEWWYAITDVIQALVGSARPRKYWNDLKKKIELQEGFGQLSENIGQLKVMAADSKRYATDCANRATLLRIIQSIPSPKAEPFKQWLAQVGNQQLEEASNPELALQHLARIYRALGRDEEWIGVRLRSVTIRKQLTDEWTNRGVKQGEEFSRLTSIISRGVFGLTPGEHKRLKQLNKENLRDHMSNLELIFQMLGEETSRQLAIKRDAQGFTQNEAAAREGGNLAGDSRRRLEKKTGIKVVTTRNFLGPGSSKKSE